MSKNEMLKIINPILFLLLINQVLTGLFGMNISYTFFVWMHRRAAWVVLIVAAVHILLNWNWVKASFFQRIKNPRKCKNVIS